MSRIPSEIIRNSTGYRAAARVVNTLQQAGHVAYLAGGCVRDMLLGHAAKDYDVATDATPEQVRALFRRGRLVGEAFGVVLVHLMRCDVEVATFRREWGYADGRHPDHVQYTDARTDAQRRDFTINGLFYDPLTDEVHDYIGGRADLEAGLIRAIGEPHQRLAEDYLRMLRAVRFSARLSWRIEPATEQAIIDQAANLQHISRERIGMEMRMMMGCPGRAAAAEMMQRYALDAPALLEPTTDEPARMLAALPPVDEAAHAAVGEPVVALAAWLIDRHLVPGRCADAPQLSVAIRQIKLVQVARRWRKALVLSNEERDALRGLVGRLAQAARWFELDRAARKRLLARQDWPAVRRLLAACAARCDRPLDLPQLNAQEYELRTEGVAPEPFIDGNDLIRAGLAPGPVFSRVLDAVYDAQLNGQIRDASQALQLALDLVKKEGERT